MADPVEFQVPNMTCGGCVRGVTRAIQSVDPAAEVKADLESHKVRVTTGAARESLVAALAEAGFEAA